MNTKEDKLCLRWADFQENTVSAFGELRGDKEFTDITLACEDGQQVEVHKVILASSSPFFMNLLRRNKHPHPLIYMRGLKSEDIVAMIDFLYFGEANVSQENLDSFLAVAEELQLKGLMGSGGQKEEENISKNPTIKRERTKPVQQRNLTQQYAKLPNLPYSLDKVEPSPPQEGTVAVTDIPLAADLQELDEKINSMMEFTEKTTFAAGATRKIMKCKMCGKE